MSNLRRFAFLVVALLIVALLLMKFFVKSAPSSRPLVISYNCAAGPAPDSPVPYKAPADKPRCAWIEPVAWADTQAERERGLGGQTGMDNMLFIFESDGKPGIWMKDMKFPIDIIWLDAQKKVVDFKESIDPASYPETFYPREPSRYVLELRRDPTKDSKMPGLKIGNYLYF